uniref:cation transporter n=1 Tax=Nocardioides sp. TaxID=35761 RepID=UPI002B26E765
MSAPDVTSHEVELAITGMTCASCANRIQRKLNKLDGVEASVNYATEKASVTYDDSVTTDTLLATVAAAGYAAAVPLPDVERDPDAGGGVSLRTRMIVSAVLSVPVIAMAMVPALQVDGWQWISLVLTTPVVVWGGLPFHRATWTNLRHGATTMDTLITMGTLAAFGWSLYALFFGSAGMIGMQHTFELSVARSDGSDNIYLEAAAGVTTFLLVGRYLEHRAKGRAGAALRALLDLGAKDVAVVRDGVETRVPISSLVVGDTFVVRPGEKIATDGTVVDGS